MRRLVLAAALALPVAAHAQQFTPGIGASATTVLTAASGNYTVPGGMTVLDVCMIGGGGGGGGVANAAASATSGMSGIFQCFMQTVISGQVIAYTVGAAGTGGAAGNNNGVAGGDTTFGSMTSKGGIGGTGSATGNPSGQTAAAQRDQLALSKTVPTATVFQTLIALQATTAGSSGLGGIGAGNSVPWALLPAQVGPNAAGGTGTGYGAPGGGATSSTGGTFAGGDGTAGAIVVVARSF